MKCPVCGVVLTMTERQGIEIDYCPQCRGVWLDRGELDKMLERSGAASAPAPYRENYPPAAPAPGYEQPGPREDWDRSDQDGYYRGKKKRESFLDDLFDFG